MIHVFFFNRVFIDIARSVVNALHMKGIESELTETIIDRDDDGLVIMFGLNAYTGTMPKRYVVYQLEQHTSRWFNERYFAKLRGAVEVWDYSLENIAALAKVGIVSVRYTPIRYSEALLHDSVVGDGCAKAVVVRNRRVAKGRTRRCKLRCVVGHRSKDIISDTDIIAFCYSMGDRRSEILGALRGVGDVKVYRDLWGARRVEAIRRAKVAVNVRFFPVGILEVVRLSYLLANGIIVVSEPSSDPVLDAEYTEYGVIITRDLVGECGRILAMTDAERSVVAAENLTRFKRVPFEISKITDDAF